MSCTVLKNGDPRLKAHETTYQASRGGSLKPTKKPTPGAPKK